MKRFLLTIVCLLTVALASTPAIAQKKKKKSKPVAAETAEQTDAAAEVALPAVARENTLDSCRDQIDNDADGHIDCGDQDCEIFAMCIAPPVVAPPPPPPPAPPQPVVGAGYRTIVGPERGRLCSDGIDNNGDGLVDCHEMSCHRSWSCRREVYFVPEPKNKPPGLMLSVGLGLALPNMRQESFTVDSGRYGEIPYSPDVGGILDLQVSYLFMPWLGFGVNFKGGGTFGTNRTDSYDYYFNSSYKYNAGKGFVHGGLFARFQYVFGRFVPYIQVGGGFSYARYWWNVYDSRESWEEIDKIDDSMLYYPRNRVHKSTKHWTVAVEPGFDFYLRKRMIALGMRAWLPVAATSDAITDNTGLMIAVTITPTWRERPQLKPEYANPQGIDNSVLPAPSATEAPMPEPEPVSAAPAAEEPQDEIEDPFAANSEPADGKPELTVTKAQPIDTSTQAPETE